METQNTISHEATEQEVNNFMSAFCPFGWLDIKAAIEYAYDAGHDEDWASEQIQNFMDETESKIDDIDPVACVMDSILQEARNEIDNVCSFDIQNDASFEIYGNYIASSWNIDEDKLPELIKALADADIDIEDLEEGTQYYLSEIGISQDDINAIIGKKDNSEE